MTKKDDESKSIDKQESNDNALSLRRARLRSNLVKEPLSVDINKDVSELQNKNINNQIEQEHVIKPSLSQTIEGIGRNLSGDQITTQIQAVALLGHIDQALNSCAGHLASLQKAAGKQSEELKVIAEALQLRAVNDSKQSFMPLLESLTAAIEPMKAIGELIPVLDRLASANEGKGIDSASQEFVFDEEEKKEFLLKEEELSRKLFEKDEELSRKLAEKEEELESIRQHSDDQWNELSAQCEELKTALQIREDFLSDKEAELSKKNQ